MILCNVFSQDCLFPVSLPVVQSAHLWQERQEWSTNGQHSCHNSRCIHWNRQILKLDWTWLQVPIGVKYFGGGPVERVPFFWYNLCFTVAYIQGVGAVRYMNTNEKMRPRSKYDLGSKSMVQISGVQIWSCRSKENLRQWRTQLQLDHQVSEWGIGKYLGIFLNI